jgi:hypothetical protein
LSHALEFFEPYVGAAELHALLLPLRLDASEPLAAMSPMRVKNLAIVAFIEL